MFSELSAFIREAMAQHPIPVNLCILAVAVLGGLLVNLLTRHCFLYGMYAYKGEGQYAGKEKEQKVHT